jgi:hypothetical protein
MDPVKEEKLRSQLQNPMMFSEILRNGRKDANVVRNIIMEGELLR